MTQDNQPIVGILLAAGAGSRFGGDKLLHPLADGVPIAVHAARHLHAVLPAIVAVVRAGDRRLGDLLEQEGCRTTECADAGRGMGASLAHAIGRSRAAAGWIVALADMPSIRPATIGLVRDALDRGASLAAPSYRGMRGHPVGFSARFLPELLALDDDTGARRILGRHPGALELLECDDPGVVLDIDAHADLAAAQAAGLRG